MALLTLDGSLTADRAVLGGKAFGIVQLLRLGIPVPPAVVITTDECARYYEAAHTVPEDIVAALPGGLAELERATGRTFGGGERRVKSFLIDAKVPRSEREAWPLVVRGDEVVAVPGIVEHPEVHAVRN